MDFLWTVRPTIRIVRTRRTIQALKRVFGDSLGGLVRRQLHVILVTLTGRMLSTVRGIDQMALVVPRDYQYVRGMRILVAVSLILAATLVATLVANADVPTPSYTVSQVQAGIARAPRDWIGRTIVVRGIVAGCRPGWMCPFSFFRKGFPSIGLVDRPGIPLARALPIGWDEDLGSLQEELQASSGHEFLAHIVVAQPCVVEWTRRCIEAVVVRPGLRGLYERMEHALRDFWLRRGVA